MQSLIRSSLLEAQQTLHNFIQQESMIQLIESAAMCMSEAIRKGGKIISCGNGGSMSDAMHFAEEMTGKFREHRNALPAMAISDPAYLSCVANDYGYNHVFSRYIEAHAHSHDVLLAISTSGNSENVLQAAKQAKQKGMHVVVLTGKDGGLLKQYADVCICVPHMGYADRIQEIHIIIIHTLILAIEQELK